ncbi:19568_t:CDS:1 [Dentiscutata erythropus]|uniref:19568_t:CDS:1 n=1 Tax=Dentiscutata erythropus TaxID=1348616 RepID=A0A9N9JHK1_9GLOM|nr:19568_t:CDS:1 [Dentiscutata erythropus]
MLQTKSQSLRKLILHGIKFDKVNLTNIAPNLEILSINNSFGNPFGEGKNNFHNLQSLELEDNEIELNRFVLKTKCESLKFFRIKERELNNEVKEEFISLLSQNYPNITTLCYITDNIIFSSTLKIFKKLCQLQIGEFAYYDLPYKFTQTIWSYQEKQPGEPSRQHSSVHILETLTHNMNFFTTSH